MMTPQEVQDKKFEKAVFGGYDMAGVDEFLERLTADYAALYKENAVLKSKLKVLVDTVEEYRSVDEAMRRTLFSAQKMADELTREAKAKSEELMHRASTEAAESARKLRADNEIELMRHKALKEQTDHFITRLAEAYAKQMESIQALKNQVFTPSSRTETAQAAKDISASVQSTVAREQPPAERPAAPPREPQAMFELSLKGGEQKPFEAEDDGDSPVSRPRFEFPDLHSQFGQQYVGQNEK